jgi:hypothetical protein
MECSTTTPHRPPVWPRPLGGGGDEGSRAASAPRLCDHAGRARLQPHVHEGWIEGWDDDAEVFLVSFAEDPPPEPPGDEGESPFVLESEIIRSSRVVVSRPNQQRFKFAVLKLYGPACAVCDFGGYRPSASRAPSREGVTRIRRSS